MKWLWLAATMLASIPGSWADSAWDRNKSVRAARVDLDGDGLRENIRLVPFRTFSRRFWTRGPYRLVVNNRTLFDNARGRMTFYIVDINRRDRFMEIAVHSYEGDWGSVQLYSYVAKKIRRVHREPLSSPEFLGNGLVTDFGSRDFWVQRENYRLNSRHTLTWLPQRFYKVNVVYPLIKPLALHPYHQINEFSGRLPRGMRVQITRADTRRWYEVRSPQGKRGWVTEDELRAHMQIAVAG